MARGDDAQPALYVHGLMVDRQEAGSGLGAAVLSWVDVHAQQHGVQRVRLDCGEDNAALPAYYRRQGFAEVDRRVVGGYRLVLLEKQP